ncbi:MAG: fumarate lyase [Spirochaetaceae bacterium]|nr:fumarate lyase [Spirochaetaceae bacterium]
MNTLYGNETTKALNSFGQRQTPFELVRAYGEVKKAALMAQQDCFKLYDKILYEKLIESVDEIIQGEHKDQFPLPLEQGGAGTSLHMNINEVIASLTNAKMGDSSTKIDGLEDIARYQSTNDTLSTAVTIMVYRQLEKTEKLIIELQEILVISETKYDQLLMIGRTELQDALPITLGQIFGGWAGSIERDRWRLNKLKERLRTIALGGTAIGTCFSAPRKYVFKAEKNLRQITGLPLCRSQNLIDEISSKDNLAEVASGFQLIALNLRKMTNDLLLYTSSFCGEMTHKEIQYGSTIMPFKSNPILLEYIKGLCISIKYDCLKINDYTTEGQLQLNAFIPFIAEAFIDLHSRMNKALNSLTVNFFPQMIVNREKINSNLLTSPALVNTLRQVIGYDNVKQLVPIIQEIKPGNLEELKKLISENTILTQEFLDTWFDPSNLTSYSENDKEFK